MPSFDTETTNSRSLSASLSLWAEHLGDKSNSTVDCYLRDIRQIAAALQSSATPDVTPTDLLNLGTADLEALVAQWSAEAPSTARRRLVSLRRYSLWLAASTGTTGHLLSATFPKIDVPVAPPVARENLEILLSSRDGARDWVSLRDEAILTLVLERGLTTGELANGSCEHLAGHLMLIYRTDCRLRLVEMTERAMAAIEAYREQCPYPFEDGAPLWRNLEGGRMSSRSLQQMLRRRRAMAELPEYVVAGAFRRNRIRELAASGMPVDLIAEQMGIRAETVLVHLRDG